MEEINRNVYLLGSNNEKVGYSIIKVLEKLGGENLNKLCADKGSSFLYYIGSDKGQNNCIREISKNSVEGQLIQSVWKELKPEPIDQPIIFSDYELDAIKREVRDVRIPQLALIRELEEKVRKEKLSFIEFFKQRLSKSLRVADDVNEYPSWEDSLAFADEDDDWTYEDATTIPLTIDGEHVIYADPKEVLEEIVSKEGTITYEKLLEIYDENEMNEGVV